MIIAPQPRNHRVFGDVPIEEKGDMPVFLHADPARHLVFVLTLVRSFPLLNVLLHLTLASLCSLVT